MERASFQTYGLSVWDAAGFLRFVIEEELKHLFGRGKKLCEDSYIRSVVHLNVTGTLTAEN